ncbi:MAG: DUF4922 domain-containing protein [Bacteroidetes bacterium]|nr:MAG: DUF4922 domain-containing protein [Bacteroidota bacterium]
MPTPNAAAELPPHTVAALHPDGRGSSLSSLSRELYRRQCLDWPMMAAGAEALNAVQVRSVAVGPYDVRLQFNPKRIVSTGAKVDAASIRERRCFLCAAHLPAEQRGVLAYGSFLVLCNPMPIFREHFTIAHVRHIPQSIEENILPFLDLAKDLAGSHAVFYNGPKCGASAPDHMHFQASPAGSIPAERDAADPARRVQRAIRGGLTVSTLKEYGRGVIVLESASRQETELGFLRLCAAMRRAFGTEDEPMLNAIAVWDGGRWRVIVIPRTKHRPAAYFREGEDQVLISPAAVDIGGLIVTPAERDFRRTDAALVEEIFREVSVSDDILNDIIGRL